MSISLETRNTFGIVYTPDPLVDKILDLIPKQYYENPQLKWLDIGAGNGAFSLNLFNRLLNSLTTIFPNLETRRIHIIKNMLYMCEIYPPHIEKLRELFSQDANIITRDFLSINVEPPSPSPSIDIELFDIIIGNPPYNINGALKTPTNKSLKKNKDGKQIYVKFVNKSLLLLKEQGHLALIIPALWLKPDKAGLYYALLYNNFSIEKLHCLSSNETQKAFLYNAQTPTCFFYGKINNKTQSESCKTNLSISLYDKLYEKYDTYVVRPDYPIPTNGIHIINKLLYFVDLVGYLKVYKSNSPPKDSIFSDICGVYKENIPTNIPTNIPNVKTTKLYKKSPLLIINYSNILQHYANQPKLILAHKMYGFPYLDSSGTYGISSRDNYILTTKDYSINELQQIQAFLSTKTALYIFSTTNYRMRYLERYAFKFIPNITKIENFPNLLNINCEAREKLLSSFFNFSQKEETYIKKLFNNYNYFIDN